MPAGLLVAIGRVHLEAAEVEGMRTVVFGTNAWEFMRSFVDEHGPGTEVLFYESWADHRPEASWQGVFAEYVESVTGFPPRSWRRYREPVAALEDVDTTRGPSFFAGYYRVENLRRRDPPLPFEQMRTQPGGNGFAAAFIPHGPTTVQW